MKKLLKAALLSRRHLSLVIGTFCALYCLTIASQLEMLSLGLLSNSGSDFFTLFSDDKAAGKVQSQESITRAQVESLWPQIAEKDARVITKQDAALYMSAQDHTNPLNYVLGLARSKWDWMSNIQAMITLLLTVAMFKAFWLFTSRYCSQLLAIRVSRDLRQKYFEHMQSLPMSFYHKHNIGSLSSRIAGDANQIANSLNSLLTNFLQTPFTIASTLIFCFYFSWKLSLVIFIGVPGIVLPIVFFARRVKKISRKLQTNQEKFASVLIDFLAGIQTVKIFSMEAFSLKKYKEQNDQMAILEAKTAKYGLLTRPVLHAITTLCLASVVLFGLYTLHMTLSQLIVFCGLLQLVYEPVKKFAEENTNIQRGIVAADRMFDVLCQKALIEDHPQAISLDSFNHSIEFRNVWFRYQGEWVLEDLSFTVEKGQTVAIIGPTGSGKSTIVQLLPRLYDIEKGEIFIDGKPLKSYTQKSLREQISFVPQKPFLFLDSVAANISFGRDYPQEAIIQAAEKAQAAEFINRLPDKYDAILSEGGQNLSGGQQQRLAIARALCKNAPILVLDEATSALDSLSEAKIKEAVVSLHGHVTQIIIAHRLSTIEHANKIIYLDRGVKTAEGTKEELLQNCQEFRAMWEMMFRTEKKQDLDPDCQPNLV